MNSDHIWVYGTQPSNRLFHLLVSVEEAPADATWQVNGKAYAGDGEVLYVGVTNDLEARMRSHKNCKTWSRRWYPRLARIEAEIFENRYEAGAAERESIQALNPNYNTAHKSGLVAA